MEPLATDPAVIGAQIRRRREASRRCEALEDGRRDPLSRPQSRAVITVRVLGGGTLEFTDCDRAVARACRDVGAQFMRAPAGAAWLVRGDLGNDVEALLSVRGYTVQAAL